MIKTNSKQIIELYLKSPQRSGKYSPLVYMKKKYSEKGIYRPLQISWDITSKCNLHCIHCYSENSGKEMDKEKIFEIMKEMKQLGTIEITFSGGEPFLRKDIVRIIEKAKQENYVLYILTNGTLISGSISREIGQILDKNDCIQVSLDGATEKINNIHRGRGTYRKIVEGIKKLLKEGIRVTINMVVTKLNYREIPDMYNLAKSLGCYSLSVTQVAPLGKANKTFTPQKEKVLEMEYETLKIVDSSKIDTHYFGILGSEIFNLIPTINIPEKPFQSTSTYINTYLCDGGKYKAHINVEGELYPCVFAQHPDLRAGNLFEKSFNEVWEEGNWKIFREKRNLINSKCAKCNFFLCVKEDVLV